MGRWTERVRCADTQQNRRQRDSSQNKGCIPAPRSTAPQSICCFCSTLLCCLPHSAATFFSIPPSFLPFPSACTLYIWLIFFLNFLLSVTWFTYEEQMADMYNLPSIIDLSWGQTWMFHNHVWLREDPRFNVDVLFEYPETRGRTQTCLNVNQL